MFPYPPTTAQIGSPPLLIRGVRPLVLRLSALRTEGSEKSLLTFLFLAFYAFYRFDQLALELV